MKIKNSKVISSILLVVVAGLVIVLSYYSFISYHTYKERESSREYILSIDKIDGLLNKIDSERVYSAIYMGTQYKSDLKSLKLSRVEVDRELRGIEIFLKEKRELFKYSETLSNISKNLNYSRTKVDIVSSDYRDTLYGNYFKKVTKPLINLLEEVTRSGLIPNDGKRLSHYSKLLKEKENLSMESSFISFILSSSMRMRHQDLLLWEKLISSDSSEDKSLTELRGEIFLDSEDGKYSVLTKEWIEGIQRKVDDIREKEIRLLSQSKEEIEVEISAIEQQTIKYISASIALLLIFFILIYLFYSNIKNSQMLTDTLSELEADLDEHQREEIKRVLKQNDTIAIYKFLVNAIKEPSRAKDHFLANMSHEIRTPLNGIIGFTNILKETELKEEQKEFIHIIEESFNNLIHIVNDILDFSKVTAGKVELEHVSFNAIEKFEASVDSYAAKATQKNINLNLFIDPTIPIKLLGDGTKISQVLINLLSNAVKFTDENGQVDINIHKVSSSENHVKLHFAVIDSGIGMTEEQQSKIFDAFSQADASTSRKFGGTGLGLTISSKFVSLMGGKLEVESRVGEGTTFFFSLDLEQVENPVERVIPSELKDLSVAYITMPNREMNSSNLQTYVEYIGADFKVYNYLQVLNMDSATLPDIVFIDHKELEDEKIISSIIALDTKTVLISTAEIERCSCSLKDEISKLLYTPINFSKTLRALGVIKTKNSVTNMMSQKVTEVDDILSPKVFKNVSALVVEDNIINQKLIQNILSNFDISVTLSSNGAEALELRENNSYDIIFMDIQMPIMDGVEATKRIIEYENEHRLKHIPIVALTANVIESDRDLYLAVGMDRYLKKPIDVAELTTIIEEYFPIKEIRDSMPLKNQPTVADSEKSKIILYKETELTAKIYAAVLGNLGYSVDMYSSEDRFLEQLDTKEYKFALFDAKPFREVNSDGMVVELIRDAGATPIAFVERDNNSNYCETLKSVGHVNEISRKLKKCS